MSIQPGCVVCGAFVGHADTCPVYIEGLKRKRDAFKAFKVALEKIATNHPVRLEGPAPGDSNRWLVTYATDESQEQTQQPDVIARQALKEVEV